MNLNKSFFNEVLFVLFVSLVCFLFTLDIFCLNEKLYDIDNRGFNVKNFYIASGFVLIVISYVMFLWKNKGELMPFTMNFKSSYIILNSIWIVLSPILLIVRFELNFPSDVYEGLFVPIEIIGTIVWVLFLNFILFCFWLLLHLFVNKKRNILNIFTYLLCFIICVFILHHFYRGAFNLAIPELLALYTVISILHRDKRNLLPEEWRNKNESNRNS